MGLPVPAPADWTRCSVCLRRQETAAAGAETGTGNQSFFIL
jgi:hypothetical protein